MIADDSHDTAADDEDADRTVTVIEGHAVQFNEYRY